jgi:hypothetical protein
MEALFAALARPTAGCPSAAARDTAMGWCISEPWVTTLDQLVDALENVRICRDQFIAHVMVAASR